MAEYVMPKPPEGMYWEVGVARPFWHDFNDTMRVSLFDMNRKRFGKDKRVDYLLSNTGWSADAEENARMALSLAEIILRSYRAQTHDVNGLAGDVVLGEGVVGRD